MVWLKIRKHDIFYTFTNGSYIVVVWLKIRKHDIELAKEVKDKPVVVWLKIRKHDITGTQLSLLTTLWFD